MTAYDDAHLVERSRASGVLAYLVKPVRSNALMPAIEIAMARYADLVAREQERSNLQGVIETQKLVARAKGLLMQTHGLTEAEAAARLARIVTKTGASMQAAAESILLTQRLSS